MTEPDTTFSLGSLPQRDAGVWHALVAKGLPQTALLRQLPRLTRLGVLSGRSKATRHVAGQLADADRLRRARLHPVNVLVAARTYAAGRGARGNGEWTPVQRITDALDAAFYAAFGAVEPAGKRTLLALDISGSLTMRVSGLPSGPGPEAPEAASSSASESGDPPATP